MKKVVRVEPLPEEFLDRKVGLLDALRWSRQQLLKGRGLWFIVGGDRVDSLVSFIHGWLSHNTFNQTTDPEWQDFETWLRDIKNEFPGEGWHVKYLQDCGGSHEGAAMKFLDFVEEFITLKRVHSESP
jgi:hypothetical protein